MLPIVEDIYFARKYLLVQNKNKIKSVQNNPVLRYAMYLKNLSLKSYQYNVTLRGVVVDLSGLRDRGPGFKTRS
jgi:hypothetical protein